jgi:hypothetical protein
MVTMKGKSPAGVLRELDIWRDDHGRIGLWIHSPDSRRNGWEIHIDEHALIRDWRRLGVSVENRVNLT